jgi:hypothetical protein
MVLSKSFAMPTRPCRQVGCSDVDVTAATNRVMKYKYVPYSAVATVRIVISVRILVAS